MKILFCLPLILLTIAVASCGQRTGIHNDKPEETTACGNSTTVSLNNISYASTGGQLFKRNCAMCHAVTDQKLTAPGLRGIEYRLPNPPEEYFIKYTLNNERVFKSGDPYAVKLKNSGWSLMPVFDSILSDQDAREIYLFLTKEIPR